VRESKAAHVEDYFAQVREQVIRFSEDRMVVDAFRAFSEGFFGSDPLPADERIPVDSQLSLYYQSEFIPRLEETTSRAAQQLYEPLDPRVRDMQYQFIAANPNPTGRKDQLDDPGDGSAYAEAHSFYHPLLRNFQQGFGYYDLFLIDSRTGSIVYSVFKEIDFATSLETGPHRDSGLAAAFRRAKDISATSPIVDSYAALEDFRSYEPSFGAPASFIASPIVNNGELIGVLAFQMPVDRINQIMTSDFRWREAGFGDSGETYLVGSDYLLRSESRFLVEDKAAYLEAIQSTGIDQDTIDTIDTLDSAIGLQPVETTGIDAAKEGVSGTDTFADYRDVLVLSSYRPLDIDDVDWVIMSEIDEAEAFRATRQFRTWALLWLLIAGIGIVVVAVLFSRPLVRPIRALSETAAAMAAGDLEVRIEAGGSDEIVELTQSFETMRSSIVDLVGRQDRAIEALTTPLIPMGDGVVVLPMVGELDSRRMARVGEELVEGVHRRGARAVLVDMTGLRTTADPDNDDAALGLLMDAFRAVHLLGVLVIMTGVQADTATRLMESGHDTTGTATETTLQLGIARAIARFESSATTMSEEGLN
jgi:methyl-accepting chemotaxis protein